MIAILCCDRDSVYKEFPDTDCYDIDKNAFSFNKDYRVICHPPCRHFSHYRHLAKKETKETEINLALFCVQKLLENGGILEHPKNSILFDMANLPKPGDHKNNLITLEINQYWFGFKVKKTTWLCFNKINPNFFEIPLKLQPCNFRNGKVFESMWSSERSKTTKELATNLIKAIQKNDDETKIP